MELIHFKDFQNINEFDDYTKNQQNLPTIGFINGDVYYKKSTLNPEKQYFQILGLSDGTLYWKNSGGTSVKTISYSKDNGETWTDVTSTTEGAEIEINKNEIILFKGNNDSYYINTFLSNCQIVVQGNIMSLIYGDDFKDKTTFPSDSNSNFTQLFRNCTGLTSAQNLKLPATALTVDCYRNMFWSCTSLTNTPELPATTLADSCYYGMFQGCSSLVIAPELSATALTTNCYYIMFQNCESLTTAPELPAETLANSCYCRMFNGCTSLVTAPELPATTLATGCYNSMFSGCTSLVEASELPATISENNCYNSMFYGCSSLTTAPELPAATLTSGCYYEMFKGCSSLNYIKCLATDISANSCTFNWVSNVASTGTFVKNAHMTSWTTGVDGIPSAWIVQDNKDYLKFKVTENGDIKWSGSNKVIQYSKNDSAWTSITASTATTISVNSGDTVLFKGNNNMYSGCTFSGTTCQFEVEGNIMSLIYGDDFEDKTTLTTRYAFEGLFNGCTKLISAKCLILPATTLSDYCYRYLFTNCTNLTKVPKLPAITLAQYCYSNMFRGCISLTTAPELPATNLALNCYLSMFGECSNLTTAPELPATTLANGCYSNMFRGCISLTTAPELPATTVNKNAYLSMFLDCSSLNYIKCLATDISATSCTGNWVNGVSSIGTFVKDASMSSWTTGANGIPNGWTVQDA